MWPLCQSTARLSGIDGFFLALNFIDKSFVADYQAVGGLIWANIWAANDQSET